MEDSDETTPIVRRCARHNHIGLLMLSIGRTICQQWVTSDEWNLPAKDDPTWKDLQPPLWPIHEGKLTAEPP